MWRGAVGILLTLVLAGAGGAGEPKPKKPQLNLKVRPHVAFSPVTIFFTAELVGGNDVEEYHCPEVEWDWDDGGKSSHEADCAPFEEGTKIERRFTATHEYGRAGVYTVAVTLRRAGRTLAKNTVRITVRPGPSDRTVDPNPSDS